jgi:thiol-disulfide isomerase/thioredoxin
LFPAGTPSPQAQEVTRLQRSLDVVGQAAPALSVRRWIGAPESGVEPFAGRVTMLYFWETWCPNCRKEVDFINDLQRRFAGHGLNLVGVTSNSHGQTDATVEAYRREHGFVFPTGVDGDGASTRAFQGGSVPTVVLVDDSGVVRWHDHPAALDDAVLERLLAEVHKASR